VIHNSVEASEIETVQVIVPRWQRSVWIVGVSSIGARNWIAVEVVSTPDVEDVIFSGIGDSLELWFEGHLNLRMPSGLSAVKSVEVGGVLGELTSRDLVDLAFLSVVVGVTERDNEGFAGVSRSTVDSG
jgi:hypothetical protein